jgi:predicted metal-dependent enzyme (double-stranded beta helix superfamily)
MTITLYGLDTFVADLRALVDATTDQQRLFDRGTDAMERLLRADGAIPEEYLRFGVNPARPNLGMFAIHRSPGLFVSTVVWGPGAASGIHDHGTWGLIGVLGNEIEETRYRRIDDRRDPALAKLEEGRTLRFRTGEVSLLRPDDEIHKMNNTTGRPTVEIHVYGLDLSRTAFNRYDPETGAVTSVQPRGFDNC